MFNLTSQHQTHRLSDYTDQVNDQTAATGLGLISLAIGLTELGAPRQLDRFLGTGDGQNAGVFRILGLREVLHGVDLLSHDDPRPGVKARVAGDLLDGALLGIAAAKSRRPSGILAALALVTPVVLADVLFAKRLSQKRCEC